VSNSIEETTPKGEKPLGVVDADGALRWIDDVLEELGHALQACADTGADELLVSAKINGFVMSLLERQPDLAARAAMHVSTGEAA
jgi:hypothetical protein